MMGNIQNRIVLYAAQSRAVEIDEFLARATPDSLTFINNPTTRTCK